MRQGPLYDAARMLRVAARRLEQIADEDATAHWGNSETVAASRLKLASEAQANIDAATARLSPYAESRTA